MRLRSSRETRNGKCRQICEPESVEHRWSPPSYPLRLLDEQPRPALDRRVYMGNRRRRAARPVCAWQVPRCDPTDDRAAPSGCCARGQETGGTRNEGPPGSVWHHRAGCRAPRGGWTGLLQRLSVHAARPASTRQPPATGGRLPSLPRRLFAQCTGNPRQLRVPQSDPAPIKVRLAGHTDRKAHVIGDQLGSKPSQE